MHDTQVATLAELAQTNPLGAQVAGVLLVVVAYGEKVYVYQGLCPHQGTWLAEGQVENGQLVCRAHNWRFGCASGKNMAEAQPGLQSFSVVVQAGRVLVDRAEIAAWAARTPPNGAPQAPQKMLRPEELPGPPGLPLLGNLHQIQTARFHLILEGWQRQYGDMYQFHLGPDRMVVITVPELVQKILQERPEKFARLRGIRETMEEMGADGLFAAEGEKWRRHRPLTMRALDGRHLRGFFPTMAAVTERLQRRWARLAKGATPLEAQKELMRYTVDITTNLAFGYDMNTLEKEGDVLQQHLERIFPMVAYRAFMPLKHWHLLKLPDDYALEQSLAALRATADELIGHARKQLAADPTLAERPQNLLQALLAAQGAEGVVLSDAEIYGNVFTFLLAGEDTTANTMAWMLYFMAQYPAVQRKMQAEADMVLGAGSTVMEYEKINALPYMEAVAHEAMRIKPVATALGLEALTEVTVGNLCLPKGTSLFVLLRPKGLTEAEFAEADQFKPERWLDYAPEANPHRRKSFLPFGAGPRLCPGRSLALQEIKMAMSMVARHFTVAQAEPERPIAERFVFTMAPQDLKITLQAR